MKITFPHMGSVYVPLTTLFDKLSVETVVPPLNNDDTKAIGCKYAPEHSCLPFKLILGNILHTLNEGADTIVMIGGSGPCRFGYFGHLLDLVAKDLGYEYTFVCLEPYTLLRDMELFMKECSCSPAVFVSALISGWAKLQASDSLERKYWYLLPYAKDKGRFNELFRRGLDKISACDNISGVKKIRDEHALHMEKDAFNPCNLPNVMMVGDIYTLNEPYSNNGIEKLFSECNIVTFRSIYTSDWLKRTLLPWKRKQFLRMAKSLAADFLKDSIGGFALDTVYHAIHGADSGFDGIVHIFPVTCMPEIVSSNILRNVSDKKRIPIMSLAIDEHMERAGIETRIEAFAELLHSKKTCAKWKG